MTRRGTEAEGVAEGETGQAWREVLAYAADWFSLCTVRSTSVGWVGIKGHEAYIGLLEVGRWIIYIPNLSRPDGILTCSGDQKVRRDEEKGWIGT